ncbi:hypothetical protein OG963_04355 [Streptomyces sp. NBC_01707]|uniref:hypothetical protein n=1 Tax=unclassified Streptomyces TaxID=2593676 RepID=UPI000D145FB0|nr:MULTISPECIES: hypothetical protein [unclassified Streptomyces]MDX3772477.1 hypothetical protein [Streptomyces sp. AK08-01B]MDX3821983.1 hypothetical protein [Streptomyces sp. AK08-01A]
MARPKPSEVDDELWAVIEPLLPKVELGAPVDIDQLQRRIALLEQDLSEKRGELEERTEELEAARAANRELTRSLNHRS